MRMFRAPPPPLPPAAIGTRVAIMHLGDAKEALSRPVWNKHQAIDAIRSAEYFIALAKEKLLIVEPV